MSEDTTFIRVCKQCGAVMEKPLEAEGKLFMFCSANCRSIWDHERAYRTVTQTKKEPINGD